jgi:hypothetical protein
VQQVQRLHVLEAPRITGGQAAGLAEFAFGDIENHTSLFAKAAVVHPASGEKAVYQVREVAIEVVESTGQVFPEVFENLADLFIEARLDDLRSALVFLLVGIAPFGDLVAQRGYFARDLVGTAGAAVEASSTLPNRSSF